jgi:hypothetical protein
MKPSNDFRLDDSLVKKVISPNYLEEKIKYDGYVIQGSELQGHTIGQLKKEFPYIRWIAYIKGCPGLKGYKKKTKIANNVKLDSSTYFWIEGPKSHINKFKRNYCRH